MRSFTCHLSPQEVKGRIAHIIQNRPSEKHTQSPQICRGRESSTKITGYSRRCKHEEVSTLNLQHLTNAHIPVEPAVGFACKTLRRQRAWTSCQADGNYRHYGAISTGSDPLWPVWKQFLSSVVGDVAIKNQVSHQTNTTREQISDRESHKLSGAWFGLTWFLRDMGTHLAVITSGTPVAEHAKAVVHFDASRRSASMWVSVGRGHKSTTVASLAVKRGLDFWTGLWT